MNGLGRVRATLRPMPAPVAAGFVALAVLSVLVLGLALVAGLLGELAERLAVAGWAGAYSIRAAYPAEDSAPRPGPGPVAWSYGTGGGGR